MIIDKKNSLLHFLIFVVFLTSMNCWIGWDGRAWFIYVFCGFLMFVYVLCGRIKLNITSKRIASFVILLYSSMYFKTSQGIISLVPFLPVFVILMLPEESQVLCLKRVSKWMAYLLIPGFVLFFCAQFITLPSIGVSHIGGALEEMSSTGYGIYSNHVFYVRSLYFSNYGMRFNGTFTEPGQLATMLSFLLMANQFDFRRREIQLLLFFNLMTFSLSGYMLTFIGYVLYRFYSGLSVKIILKYTVPIVLLYLGAILYNGGDNLVNNLIFTRLQYDEETGFSGNNRAFGLIPYYYATMWSDSRLILYGYGKETMEWLAQLGSRGTGYVYWMVSYGVIGTIVASLFYLYNVIVAKNRKFAILFFVFLVFVFWQRSKPFWISWYVCFVYGITYASVKVKNGILK